MQQFKIDDEKGNHTNVIPKQETEDLCFFLVVILAIRMFAAILAAASLGMLEICKIRSWHRFLYRIDVNFNRRSRVEDQTSR